jgi:hypothetical protein
MKILCVIPALPDDLKQETVESVHNQTVPVDDVLIVSEKITDNISFPAKISKALNNALSHINLEDFDYILRVDGDTIIPSNFVEENLKENPHVTGDGDAMIIHVPSFLREMGGRFFDEQDDTYVRFKFAQDGLRSTNLKVQPIRTRKCGAKHSYRYYVERGEIMYRFGYEPLHVLSKFLLDRRNAFLVFGYLKGLLLRYKHFDVYDYVRWEQAQHFLCLRSKMRAYI